MTRAQSCEHALVFAPGRLHCLRPALLLALLGVGLGLGPIGCFGGPTSDLPSKADDDGLPTDGATGDDDNGGDSEGSDTGGTPGSNGGGMGSADAGAAGEPPSDAGQQTDAAVPPACPWSTPPVEAVSCGGSHCALSRAQLSAAPGAVCESTENLDAVCTGDPQRVVHACWRSNMISFDRATAVKTCASAEPLLSMLSSECLDCYVALHECVSAMCALECALENSGECEPCTNQKCVPAFTTCSGLSTP